MAFVQNKLKNNKLNMTQTRLFKEQE